MIIVQMGLLLATTSPHKKPTKRVLASFVYSSSRGSRRALPQEEKKDKLPNFLELHPSPFSTDLELPILVPSFDKPRKLKPLIERSPPARSAMAEVEITLKFVGPLRPSPIRVPSKIKVRFIGIFFFDRFRSGFVVVVVVGVVFYGG